jgi:hypothetical protein
MLNCLTSRCRQSAVPLRGASAAERQTRYVFKLEEPFMKILLMPIILVMAVSGIALAVDGGGTGRCEPLMKAECLAVASPVAV